jgi:hypothetical protein
MSGIMSMLLGAVSSAAAAADEFFNRVTLLLNTGSTNGAQNNTFLDSGTANGGVGFTITRNGNPTQGTFTPFSQTGWSNFATAASASVGLSNSTAALVSSTTTTFTAECWVYMTEAPVSGDGVPALIGMDATFNTSIYLGFGPNASRQLVLRWFDGASKTATGGTALALNTWYHIALVSNANALAMYVNGVAETLSGTTTLTNRNSTTNTFSLFLNSSSSNYQFRGYASNIRVCTSAVYTGAFTPSTTPLTTTSQGATNCKLLTAQDNRFVDNSSNAYVLTLQSTPSVQAFSPFAPTAAYSTTTVGGSGYFDGTGDYLTFPSDSAFSYGTSDYSQEFWIYLTTSPATFQRPLQYSDDRDNIVVESSNFNFYDGAASTISAATTGQWFHLCVTRVGGTLRGFVNGKLGFTRSGTYNSSTRSLALGATSGGSNPLGGYTANYRIVKGGIPTAYSTSSTTVGAQIFTPLTTPFTGSESLTAGSLSLLCNFTNAGIYDAAAKNDLETVGGAQVSTTQAKFGTTSMYFDGTGDALAIPTSQKENLRFGTGNFTIEFWAWKSANGSAGYDTVISVATSGNASGGFILELSSSRGFGLVYDSTFPISSNFNPNDSTWHHYAIVRNGSTFALYKDGTQLTTATLTPTLGINGDAFVGSAVNSSTVNFNGYIDDLRVSKFARYTASFTAPTAAFPTQ